MSNLKKHSILIIMAMLILIMIPMSLAATDVEDNNATDVIGISEIDEVDVDLSSTDDSNTESASEDDVLSAGHDYETTPSPNTLNYVEGGDNTVTGTVSCDYTYTSAPMHVYINGDGVNDRQVVNGVYGNKASFTYDVSKISSHLKEGENILKFHIDESYLTNDWLSDFQYNPLTVIVGGSSTEPYTGIIYVNETGDNSNDGSEESPVATIAQAIVLATDGEHEAKIIITEGTYTEHDIIISTDLEIIGQGNAIIDANNEGRIFKITSGDVKLTDLTLTNGAAPKDVDGGYEQTYPYDPITLSAGGAIYVADGSVDINNLTFISNTATDYAGAIYLKGDKSRISNSTFKANSANDGGAIYIINDYYCEGILIEGNEFESNVASNQGGAIAVVEDSNDANIIKNNTFTKNEAVNGGAIASDDGYVKVFNNTFDANTAEMGAAVISTGYINLNNNTMTGNVASISGNEIYNAGTITSYVTIVFLNGETVTVNDGKAVELTVKVTDDNGNSISGGDVTFTVNDEQTLNDPSDLVNGVSTVKFTPRQNGTLTVSGSYSGVYDDRFTLTEGYLNVSNAVPEYFGIIYVDSEGDDENDGDSNNPVKTLYQAIFLATREGGSNQIVIRQGTYKVTGYTFTDSINITGEGNPTLDAENNNAMFTLSGKENTNFVFTGLTFANGYAHMVNWGDSENGGAISLKGGNLFLENDKFINNTATMGGGAIYIAQGPMDYDTYQYTPSTAKITGCEFENNGNGKNYGGAIYIYGAKASADITGSTFEKNTAGSGGAIYVSSSTVNITDCEFNNNNATADGGALYVSASANIKNNEFTGNNATKYSSSMYLYKSSWGNNEIALEGNTIYSEDSEIYTNNLDIKGFVINILDGETQTFCEGDITLYATVHDDNYNKISSNSFTFVINTTEESTTLDNGEATLVYNAKLTDDGAVVTTTVVSSEDGAEVNPGKLEIVEYNIIFNFDDEIGHAGKTLTLYVTVEDAAGNIIKDNITVSFNNEEFEASINEDDEFEINLKMPETPQTLDLKLSYNGFNQTHTVEVVSYYDGVIYVSPSGDDDNNGSEDAPVKTIEQAIELASDKDNVAHKIIIAEGTYNENSLSIETPLEIIGQGKVIIDAQQEGRIFNMESDANISGITFKNGKEEDGAAIYISDGKVNIDNCIFQENTADNAGAAIFWDANDGKLTNTVFENNTARNGAVSLGVFSWSAGTTGKNTLVENCTFNNNHNTVYGNGIGLDVTGDDVVIKNTNFTNNKGESGSEHGALYIKGSNVEVDNCLFENNSMGMAAAIQIDGEDAVIKNSKFINNTVTNGLVTRSGAIELQGSAEITGCTFINNGGDDCVEGGAINVVCADYVGDILISNNEFINNSAKAGAAIFVDGGSEDYCQFDSLTIEGNTFKDNVADVGSAVYVENSEGLVTIQNNEIVTSEGDDNAIYVDEDTASDVTVGDNPVTYSTSINVTTNAPALGENATITVTISKGATGNVTVKVGDNIAETVKISNGTAVLNVPNLGVGSYDVVVNYDGDENYTKAEASATLTVSKATPSADDVMDINVPAGTTSPTFSIKLPSDATGNLTVTVDGENYTASLTNGTASITVPNLASGNHNVTVSYSGDDKYGAISKNTTVSIPVIALTGNDVAMLYSSSAQYKVRVTADGKPVSGVVVTFKFNGKTLNVKTDANGYASYKIPVVKPQKAKYTITATYNGITKTNNVKVNSIIKAANKKVKKSKKVTKIKITLKKVNKKYLNKKTIKIKFKGKTYKVKTNKKGVATWKVKKSMLKKLKVGKKYKYKVTYGKDTVTKKLTIKK